MHYYHRTGTIRLARQPAELLEVRATIRVETEERHGIEPTGYDVLSAEFTVEWWRPDLGEPKWRRWLVSGSEAVEAMIAALDLPGHEDVPVEWDPIDHDDARKADELDARADERIDLVVTSRYILGAGGEA